MRLRVTRVFLVLSAFLWPQRRVVTQLRVVGVVFSEDGSFSFGFSQLRGKRASMEDFQDARIAKVGDKIVGLFGVFDGQFYFTGR